jgi:hypothetical protein
MAQRRHHAERAFEKLLRAERIPYVAVNEARKALLPAGAVGSGGAWAGAGAGSGAGVGLGSGAGSGAIKNFDFIAYGQASNLLVEVKGRSIPATRAARSGLGAPRLESWVTLDDVEALGRWQTLFGPGYEAVFVFVYACPDDQPPPDGLFAEVIEQDGRWYAVRAIALDDYRSRMKVRSPKWRTVHLGRDDFERLSRPFAGTADPFDARTGSLDQTPALELLGA